MNWKTTGILTLCKLQGGQKACFFDTLFCSVWKDLLVEIVKQTHVFVKYSAHSILKSWLKNNVFLMFHDRHPSIPPQRKCQYYIGRVQNLHPKTLFWMIFRRCPGRALGRFIHSLFRKPRWDHFSTVLMKFLTSLGTSDKWFFVRGLSIVNTLFFQCDNNVFLFFSLILYA